MTRELVKMDRKTIEKHIKMGLIFKYEKKYYPEYGVNAIGIDNYCVYFDD